MAAPMAVAGVGLQAYSMYQSSQNEADAARVDAQNRELQAEETEHQLGRTTQLLHEQGAQVKGDIENAAGQAGVEMSGGALSLLEDTNRRMYESIAEATHTANFQADQLRRGANLMGTLSGQYSQAGLYGGAGTILTGAGKLAALYDPKRNPNAWTGPLDGNYF